MRLLPCASLPSCPPFGTGSSPQHASFPAAAVMRAIQPTTLLPSPPQPPSLTGSVFWSLPRLHGTLFSHLFKTPFNSSQAAPLSLQPPCHSQCTSRGEPPHTRTPAGSRHSARPGGSAQRGRQPAPPEAGAPEAGRPVPGAAPAAAEAGSRSAPRTRTPHRGDAAGCQARAARFPVSGQQVRRTAWRRRRQGPRWALAPVTHPPRP